MKIAILQQRGKDLLLQDQLLATKGHFTNDFFVSLIITLYHRAHFNYRQNEG